MTPLERILPHFPDAKRSGQGWSARCPAHEDRNPSLSLGEGDDGRALIHCHRGCSPEAICNAKGISLKDLGPSEQHFPRPRQARSGFASAEDAIRQYERKLGTRSRTWQYVDARGIHVGTVIRWERADGGKEFRPVSLIDGQWQLCGMPAPRPLYQLPEVVRSDRVFVTEGEKAADAAKSLGFIATTSTNGAKSPRKSDWSPLAGKDVVILPDNDEEGRNYATDVAAILWTLEPRPRIRIAELPNLPVKGDIADLVAVAGRDGITALRDEVEVIVGNSPPQEPPADERIEVAHEDDNRPTVWIEKAEKPRITDQSLAVLASDHFQRGGQLVRCVPSPNGVRILAVTREAVDDILNRRICFKIRKENDDGPPIEIKESAPAWLSKNIVELQHWPGIRELEAVHHGPFIRPDGTVGGLRPGYDPVSKGWIDTTEDWSELEIPPTEQQAQDAASTLLGVVDEFPFESTASAAVWIAAILTRVARAAFNGPSPLFVISASTPGSGKTLLSRLISLIADGRSPGMKTLSSSEEETRKMLTSSLMEGETILVFDNVNKAVQSPALDGFLTSTRWSDRVLGTSQIITLPNLTVPILTANNGTLGSDTARRSLVIRLSPLEERPEDRCFKINDLDAYVREHRQKLLIAAIRILQWHFLRGCPQNETYVDEDVDSNVVVRPVKRFGSFEAWSATVRQAAIGVGLPDPLASAQALEVVDDGRANCRMFLECWRDWNATWQGSARQLIEALFTESGDFTEPALRFQDAILQFLEKDGPDGEKPSAEVLGRAIGKIKGRNFSNLKVEWMGHSSSGTRWRLTQVNPQP